MENNAYDYIVIGVGGIGSATLYWLSKNAPKKSKILGLEQFELGHIRGGSQDFSRITRKLYHTPLMTNFASNVHEPWYELEKDSGLKLVHLTGALFWTSADTGHLSEVDNFVSSMKASGHLTNRMSGADIRKRWPQFTFDTEVAGVFDPEAGLVDAAMGNAAHQQCAEANGVKILQHTKVQNMRKLPNGGMTVETNKGTFTCKKVIVTSGAWVNQVLASCGTYIPVKVSQENVTYFSTPHLKSFTKENFPVFLYLTQGGYDLYALPVHGLAAFKIGADALGEAASGDVRDFVPDPRREQLLRDFLRRFLPTASAIHNTIVFSLQGPPGVAFFPITGRGLQLCGGMTTWYAGSMGPLAFRCSCTSPKAVTTCTRCRYMGWRRSRSARTPWARPPAGTSGTSSPIHAGNSCYGTSCADSCQLQALFIIL